MNQLRIVIQLRIANIGFRIKKVGKFSLGAVYFLKFRPFFMVRNIRIHFSQDIHTLSCHY